MEQKSIDILEIEKLSTKKWVEKLLNFLITNYGFGNYNFDVFEIIGYYDEDKGFVFQGGTQNVTIYDILNTDENYESGWRPSHFFIESEGIVYLEFYIWWDNFNEMRILDIKKMRESLTSRFKLLAYQIINKNYNEK